MAGSLDERIWDPEFSHIRLHNRACRLRVPFSLCYTFAIMSLLALPRPDCLWVSDHPGYWNLWVFLNGRPAFETVHELTCLDGGTPKQLSPAFKAPVVQGNQVHLEAVADGRYRVLVTVIDRGQGVYRLEYKIENWTKKGAMYRLESSIRGTNLKTSNVKHYETATTEPENTDCLFFQGSLINAAKAVALVPGNGFDNCWTLWNSTLNLYEGQPFYPARWRNTKVSEKKHFKQEHLDGVFVTYGQLADESDEEFSVAIDRGEVRVLAMAVGIGVLEGDPNDEEKRQRGVQKFLQETYHDAFSSSPRQSPQKAMWATAHQLMRNKGYAFDGGPTYLSVPPNFNYAPDFYWEDGAEEVIGLGEPKWVIQMIRSELAFGQPGGTVWDTDSGGHMTPKDAMNHGNKIVVPWLIASRNCGATWNPPQRSWTYWPSGRTNMRWTQARCFRIDSDIWKTLD
jgi:hypothetical protein